MSKSKNVYIVARYAMKPRNPSQTFIPGYMKDDANVRWDESVDVTVGIKDRDLSMAKIILNISEQKVVKNGFNNDMSFMEFFQYFYTQSPKEISQALKNVGITLTEQKESSGNTDINTVSERTINEFQENVSVKTEESPRPEPASATDVAIPGEGDKKRRRKHSIKSKSDASSAGGDREPQAETEPSNVSD